MATCLRLLLALGVREEEPLYDGIITTIRLFRRQEFIESKPAAQYVQALIIRMFEKMHTDKLSFNVGPCNENYPSGESNSRVVYLTDSDEFVKCGRRVKRGLMKITELKMVVFRLTDSKGGLDLS